MTGTLLVVCARKNNGTQNSTITEIIFTRNLFIVIEVFILLVMRSVSPNYFEDAVLQQTLENFSGGNRPRSYFFSGNRTTFTTFVVSKYFFAACCMACVVRFSTILLYPSISSGFSSLA